MPNPNSGSVWNLVKYFTPIWYDIGKLVRLTLITSWLPNLTEVSVCSWTSHVAFYWSNSAQFLNHVDSEFCYLNKGNTCRIVLSLWPSLLFEIKKQIRISGCFVSLFRTVEGQCDHWLSCKWRFNLKPSLHILGISCFTRKSDTLDNEVYYAYFVGTKMSRVMSRHAIPKNGKKSRIISFAGSV